MDARWAIVALLATTVVLVSTQPVQTEDSAPSLPPPYPLADMQYGLGLEIPDALPRPGPFAEGPEAMARLENFMRFQIPDVVQRECGIEGMSLEDALRGEQRLWSFDSVYNICESYLRGGDKATTLNSMDDLSKWIHAHLENGTIEEAYASEMNASLASLQQTMDALGMAPIPADPVEAQLLAWFAFKTEWGLASMETAIGLHSSYQEDQNFWSIQNSFLNLHIPKIEARLTLSFLEAYPWKDSDCTSNQNPEEITDRVLNKYEKAIEVNPLPKIDIDFPPPQELVMHQEPKLELYAEQGWWPGLLWVEQILDWWIAVGTHMDEVEVYPTQEEGIYLVQEYRNHTRTLSTDHILDFLHPDAQRYYVWDGNPAWVAQSLHVNSLTWRFEGVGCLGDA